MLTKLIILGFSVLLAGCASTISSGTKPRLAPPNPEKVTIYVFDSVEGVNLVVNDAKRGGLGRHDYTWFQLPAGTLDISLNDPWQTSRKLTARRIVCKSGESVYLKYDIVGHESDGALLFEALSGASKGQVNFKPEYLVTIDEAEAHLLAEKYKLIGNLIE
jgi:hypothetical protein